MSTDSVLSKMEDLPLISSISQLYSTFLSNFLYSVIIGIIICQLTNPPNKRTEGPFVNISSKIVPGLIFFHLSSDDIREPGQFNLDVIFLLNLRFSNCFWASRFQKFSGGDTPII